MEDNKITDIVHVVNQFSTFHPFEEELSIISDQATVSRLINHFISEGNSLEALSPLCIIVGTQRPIMLRKLPTISEIENASDIKLFTALLQNGIRAKYIVFFKKPIQCQSIRKIAFIILAG